jgi:acyl-CoA synthetase (AMP-forming)/AMP-acid ligase II
VNKAYIDSKLTLSQQNQNEVIALLTLSDMSMVINLFALSRLGYTVMMLSPRLPAAACVSLLSVTGCNTLLHGDTINIRSAVEEIVQLKQISLQPLRSWKSQNTARKTDDLDMETIMTSAARNPQTIALILHSSGSTGTPKPIYLSHKSMVCQLSSGTGFSSFNPLPWYHLHGLTTALQTIFIRKTAFMWDASAPLTVDSLVSALRECRPEVVQVVPYILQLVAEDDRGIEMLRQCKLVTYGASQCPDELGNKLVEAGVKFGGLYGL